MTKTSSFVPFKQGKVSSGVHTMAAPGKVNLGAAGNPGRLHEISQFRRDDFPYDLVSIRRGMTSFRAYMKPLASELVLVYVNDNHVGIFISGVSLQHEHSNNFQRSAPLFRTVSVLHLHLRK